MEYVLTGKEMKDLDTYTIEKIGFSSLVLMENAAQEVFQVIQSQYKKGRILILCGVGNNGADGLCVYRKLKLKNYPCDCMVIGKEEKSTKEFQIQRHILEQLGINIRQVANENAAFDFSSYTYIVDAIFGVGLKRDLQGLYVSLVQAVNVADAYVYAVDIPSGICAEDGHICGCAVKATQTVTFGYKKIGMICYPGREYSGDVIVADIGYPPQLCEQLGYHHLFCTKQDILKIPERPNYSHKGTFGRVLVVAGSREYSGAAWFAALSAYRMGSGLVKVVTHKENKQFLTGRLPEGLFLFYDEINNQDFRRDFLDCLAWADVIVAGSGLGTSSDSRYLVELILQQNKKIVLDADALNIISMEGWQNKINNNIMITPHLKEMERLTGRKVSEIQKNLKETAVRFANDNNCVVILKDAVTIITDGTFVFYNESGNCGMATGGSGDVLAGVLAGSILWWEQFLKLKNDTQNSEQSLEERIIFWTALGVYIHGLAGDEAAKKKGKHAMLASDIAENLDIIKDFINQV